MGPATFLLVPRETYKGLTKLLCLLVEILVAVLLAGNRDALVGLGLLVLLIHSCTEEDRQRVFSLLKNCLHILGGAR